MTAIKLHIGGQERREGWKILDPVARPETDFVGTADDLSCLADESCAEIYASHVLEHLGYDGELQAALAGFYRVLAPGGRLRVSVPDMDVLCRLFLHPSVKVDGKFQIMRMLFGGRQDAHDVHLSGLNFDFLGNFLTQAGFSPIRRVQEFGEFANDGSSYRFLGVLVSCNIEAFKGSADV